jgi:hypothetical protein
MAIEIIFIKLFYFFLDLIVNKVLCMSVLCCFWFVLITE